MTVGVPVHALQIFSCKARLGYVLRNRHNAPRTIPPVDSGAVRRIKVALAFLKIPAHDRRVPIDAKREDEVDHACKAEEREEIDIRVAGRVLRNDAEDGEGDQRHLHRVIRVVFGAQRAGGGRRWVLILKRRTPSTLFSGMVRQIAAVGK